MSAKSEREEAITRLREWLKPGDTVYCVLRHVSRSGMSRVIEVVKIEHNEPTWLGWNVAQALGYSYDRKREGIKVSGTGMDMGFHLVSTLSQSLFGDSYALKHRWI